MKYRVTHHVVSNLPLTSKQKFRFCLARPGQARPKQNFTFEINGRFCTRRWVSLYLMKNQMLFFKNFMQNFISVGPTFLEMAAAAAGETQQA